MLFINKSINNLLHAIFCPDVHNYQRVPSTTDKIFTLSCRNNSYVKNSVIIGAISSWNKTQHQFSNLSLKTYSPTKIKSLLSNKCIENY